MKKIYTSVLMAALVSGMVFAETTAFDSMDKAVEVKLAPSIKTNNTKTTAAPVQTTTNTSIQAQKYNNALTSLDDAQVELRQDLSTLTEKYNNALVEKERAIQNCKTLKKEIKAINKKMKNVDKSKKMINANLENGN